MLRIITGLLILITCSLPAFAQAAKGVDKQNERVRDSGSERTPANNGNKTDTGAGRGMDFGKGRTPETPPLPNPYRLSGRRDVMINAVQELMRDRKLVVDESAISSPGRCPLTSRNSSGPVDVNVRPRRSASSHDRIESGPFTYANVRSDPGGGSRQTSEN